MYTDRFETDNCLIDVRHQYPISEEAFGNISAGVLYSEECASHLACQHSL